MFRRGGELKLQLYHNANWPKDYGTKQSTSGNYFFSCSTCISWLSKKEATVGTSSCEAENRAAFTVCIYDDTGTAGGCSN